MKKSSAANEALWGRSRKPKTKQVASAPRGILRSPDAMISDALNYESTEVITIKKRPDLTSSSGNAAG